MNAPDLKDWLPIVFERANAATALWNVEIAAILGIIAFVAAAGQLARHGYVRFLLAAGFAIMAAINLAALVAVTEQRAALIGFVESLHDDRWDGLLHELSAETWQFGPFQVGPLLITPIWLLLSCHIVADLFVLLFLLRFGRERQTATR